ncbi:MAG: MBL fold metallo-hydrolase [Deltaproteobacteria bacterium]|nr:MBL fold metallo-hydrolase [Deltaproteobacteria bacterium]
MATAAPLLQRSPVPELPRLHQIVLPTPWEIGPVQVYLVEGDPLTLIDTGVARPESRRALEAAFDQLGLGLEEVERVVLTHHHTDHMGQVQALRDAGADLALWVHEDDAEDVELYSMERDERIEVGNELFREYGVPEDLLARQAAHIRAWIEREPPLCAATRVERRLRGGDRVPFKDFELEVIHAPGHTAGHVLLHEPRSGTLLTGDHLMGQAVPFTESYFLASTAAPGDPLGRRPCFRGLPAYLGSLRGLRGRSFRRILPAHGGIIDRPARAIEEAILFYSVRIQRIERALARAAESSGAASAWAVWQALFPKLDPLTQMRTRMMMVIGGLDELEACGRVRVEWGPGGILLHAPIS